MIKQYSEAIMVLFLYQIGEYLSDLVTDRGKSSMRALLKQKNEIVHLIDKDIKPEEVKIGDTILVKVGEMVPVDGILVSSKNCLNYASVTGESCPVKVKKGDNILSGGINLEGVLLLKATNTFSESMMAKVIKMVEESKFKKSNQERWITKFSKIYTPIVVIAALLLTVIPFLLGQPLEIWLYRSLTFLVISCPCALVISVPLGYFCGVAKASQKGIVIKGTKDLEKLKDIKIIVLDKTGTITNGYFQVTKIIPYQVSKEELIEVATYGEYYSNHPIAAAIKEVYNKKIDKLRINDYQEITGKGIVVTIDGTHYLFGNSKLLDDYHVNYPKIPALGSIILVAKDNEYIGTIVISDTIKPSCLSIVKQWQYLGIAEVWMISGDQNETVKKVANRLNIKNYRGEMLPLDKVKTVTELKEKGPVLFIGDGMNDAPVLAAADVGVSMGGIGSDIAIEASDILLLDDNPMRIKDAYLLSIKTNKIVTFNIIFALTVKIICLILSTFGLTNMWLAVFADVGVTLLSILNSLRIFK